MSSNPTKRPFGTWSSPVTPEATAGMREISEPLWSAQGFLLWKERFSDSTRLMLQDLEAQTPASLTPEMDIGGGLLYGGGSHHAGKGTAAAVEKKTARLLRLTFPDRSPGEWCHLPGRAASPRLSPDQRQCLFVHSHHDQDSLRLLPAPEGKEALVLDDEADFYNYPRWHPDGNRIAWVSWDHPHMPWDSAVLHLAWLKHDDQGAIAVSGKTTLAGGEDISIVQPEFSPDGSWLAYVSDRTGWWQLYLHHLASGRERQLTHQPAEHGLPAWLQNMRTYGFSSSGERMFFIRNQQGFATLWMLDLARGTEEEIKLDPKYTWLEELAVSPLEDTLALIASGSAAPASLITVDTAGNTRVIRESAPKGLPAEVFSSAEPISWPSRGGVMVHGLFYPPHNPNFTSPGKPPLLVMVHSGPTRQKWAEFQPRTQYFTSRGYAVLVVNYRGSTGYGRTYREALYGNWGVVDVEDCLSGARYTAEQDWVDPNRMALLGSSAGGFTVLQTLVKHPGVFRAGVSMYGIANHISLLEDPPKFERFYSHKLLGPYPEAEKLYRARSPLFHADRIRDPVAIFQGGKDHVVPREQAEAIVAALEENGVPHQYILYPEEGHGFKRTENVQDFYRQAEAFLRKHLDI